MQAHSLRKTHNSMTDKSQKLSFMLKVTFWKLSSYDFDEFSLKYCNFASFWARTMFFTYKWGRIEPGRQWWPNTPIIWLVLYKLSKINIWCTTLNKLSKLPFAAHTSRWSFGQDSLYPLDHRWGKVDCKSNQILLFIK